VSSTETQPNTGANSVSNTETQPNTGANSGVRLGFCVAH
jgi:hypothetical protein